MAYRIIYTKRFNNKLKKLSAYLITEWGLTVFDDFTDILKNRIAHLSHQPFVGKTSPLKQNIRSILITKHNRIYYRVTDNTITIVNLFDTRINPKKKPYNVYY